MKLNLPDFLKISCTDMMEKRVSCFELPVKTKKRLPAGIPHYNHLKILYTIISSS